MSWASVNFPQPFVSFQPWGLLRFFPLHGCQGCQGTAPPQSHLQRQVSIYHSIYSVYRIWMYVIVMSHEYHKYSMYPYALWSKDCRLIQIVSQARILINGWMAIAFCWRSAPASTQNIFQHLPIFLRGVLAVRL